MHNARTIVIALLLAVGLTGLGTFAVISNAQESRHTTVAANVQGTFDHDATRGWLGIALADLTPELATKLGISATSGVVIINVAAVSPAHDAGLLRGDVIAKVNGAAVANVKEAMTALKDLTVGAAVTLSITKNGNTSDLSVTAAARPQPAQGHGPKGGALGRHGGLPFLGHIGGMLPELKDIPRDQFFSHILGGQRKFKDKDGNVLTQDIAAGTVASAQAGSMAVNLNESGQKQYTLGDDVKFFPETTTADNIADGAKVVVISLNGQVRTVVALVPPQPRTGTGDVGPQRQNFDNGRRQRSAAGDEGKAAGFFGRGPQAQGQLGNMPNFQDTPKNFQQRTNNSGGAGAGAL
ncbi:MAG: PDZ domain-containing protein [Dehalococcoidia bacterium]|nr:PDZ domain-containing protein [Dehalococcoidia bacterium]